MTSPSHAWSQVARAYQRNIVPGFTPAAAALCTALRIGPGDRVLDVACGPGTLALAALRQGAEQVTGVDFAAEMIALAKAAAIGKNAEFFLGDATGLPVSGGAFDVAASSFGVIFAPDPRRATSELHRALAPGGRAGMLAWLRGDTTNAYYDRVYRHIPRPATTHDPYAWGDRNTARAWFGEWFGYLEFATITVPYEGASPSGGLGGAPDLDRQGRGGVRGTRPCRTGSDGPGDDRLLRAVPAPRGRGLLAARGADGHGDEVGGTGRVKSEK